MKRIILASTLPEVIKYTKGNVTYSYKEKYRHVGDSTTHNGEEGTYYEVFLENGEPCSPSDVPILDSEIDVYDDWYVGFIWNGRLNYLGILNDDGVITK